MYFPQLCLPLGLREEKKKPVSPLPHPHPPLLTTVPQVREKDSLCHCLPSHCSYPFYCGVATLGVRLAWGGTRRENKTKLGFPPPSPPCRGPLPLLRPEWEAPLGAVSVRASDLYCFESQLEGMEEKTKRSGNPDCLYFEFWFSSPIYLLSFTPQSPQIAVQTSVQRF